MEYLLDKEPIKWNDLVRKAKELGYEESNGIYTTSRAAHFLRLHGHTVEHNPDYKEPVNN